MGNQFLRIAVVYLLAGVAMGVGMGITKDFTLRPVHAHVNLLGWASMALFGLFYKTTPRAGETTLAKIHFWVHNLAAPIMMVSLGLEVSGYTAAEPVLAASSLAIVAGLVCFAVNLWKHTGSNQLA
jgi:hypothetical protein